MAMNADDLATKIREDMGFPAPNSDQIIGWATGVVNELTQNGLYTFGGSPSGHIISGITPATLAQKIADAAGYGSVSPELLLYCTGVTTYIISSSIVTYVGPPPPASPDWFLGGTISGMVGSGMALAIATSVGFPKVTPELLKKSTAMVDYIQANAQVESGVIS